MERSVESESEISHLSSSDIVGGYHDNYAASLVYAELLGDDVLSAAGFGVFRVERGFRVDDDLLYLEDGWDADDQGEKPDYEDGPVMFDDSSC